MSTITHVATSFPFAHATWFAEDRPGDDTSLATEPLTLALLAGAVLLTIGVRLLARVRDGITIPPLARLAPYMPFAVRIHLAVSLLGLLSLGTYLSPAMPLEKNVGGVILGTIMAVVTVLMATGWQTRIAALLLLAAGPIGMLEYGVSPILQRIDMVGLALFVLLAGPGRWSADFELGRARDPERPQAARAIWSLRVATGVALIIVAFVEKLLDPQLTLDILADHPVLNVADAVGLPLSDLQYVRLTGVIEILFGLLLISGALPQLGVLIIGVPFNATLFFFGSEELVGHLPVYGTMLVLLVYGSHRSLRDAVSMAWPWGRVEPDADPLRSPAPAPAGVSLRPSRR
jgi:uncharacterized membrane protein YphA (DoxX/SURF4 family)